MQTLDWLIVGGYLMALGAVGIIATLRVRNTGRYYGVKGLGLGAGLCAALVLWLRLILQP